MSASVDAFSLEDKNILITGASSGIGRECCIECSKRGANIVLVGRNEERLQDTLDNLAPGNHLIMKQELTEYEKLEELVSIAVNKLGKLNGFVHSAGIEIVLPIKLLDHSHYEKAFAVNVITGYELAKAIVKKKNFCEKGGSLVFIASVAGLGGQAGKLAYSSSKAALINGVKTLALELASKNIRVNSISPGICNTEMSAAFLKKIPEENRLELIKKHPLGIGEPIDIANASVFLLSEASRWITGINLIVDGGYSA